ncbi:MAG TPA: ATP-binding protein [Deltaproteobacteria bacterium]|nr:ATP-binding protein [Deltaproteobacteria bacterium]
MISKKVREFIYIFLIFGMIALLSVARTNIRHLKDLSLSSNIVIFAVISLNVVLLVLVIFLVTRNIAKLLMERQRGVLGTKLRSKLVSAFVLLTLIPTMVLFFTSILFLNSSMEGWLSSEVETAIEESMNVANIYYKEASAEAIHYASSMSSEITERRLLKEENLEILQSLLKERMELFRLSSVVVYSAQGEELVKIVSPEVGTASLPSTQSNLVHGAMEGRTMSIISRTGDADVIEGIVPIRSSFNMRDVVGVLVADYYIPESLSGRMTIIRNTFTDYIQSLKIKGPIKTNYIIILTSITLLVLFSAVWFGMNISKGLINPIEKLVEGTQKISRGDLGFSIDVQSNDELGLLVQDFNTMVSDLKESRRQLEIAYNDIQNRNRYIGTVLNNISTGVITLMPDDTVIFLNPAARAILGIPQEAAVGKRYDEVFGGDLSPIATDLIENFKKSKGIASQKQITVSVRDKRLTLMGHASFLYDDNDEHLGTVVVIDDLTELQKMERMAAWREVARRIAHEVKNPLTPIQLSAQRLRRRYLEKLGQDSEVFDECTRVIIKEVDEMKRLVNEFSAFAKMPSCMPVPGDLNKVIQDAVTLYRQAHPQIAYELVLDEALPMVEIDSPQMSRAIVNLLENASTAVIDSGNAEMKVSIRTCYDSDVHIATLDIADTGTGIPPKVKERLFEPYFSTKRGGTGLGLVIVNRIVSDHNGFIRLKDNLPTGTVFSIELPVKE